VTGVDDGYGFYLSRFLGRCCYVNSGVGRVFDDTVIESVSEGASVDIYSNKGDLRRFNAFRFVIERASQGRCCSVSCNIVT